MDMSLECVTQTTRTRVKIIKTWHPLKRIFKTLPSHKDSREIISFVKYIYFF